MGIRPDHPPVWPGDFIELPPEEQGRAVCHRCAREAASELLRRENKQLATVAPYVARWRVAVRTDKYDVRPPAFEPYWRTARRSGDGDGWMTCCAACDACLEADPATVMSMEHHPDGWPAGGWPGGGDEETAVVDERKAVLEPLLRLFVLDRLFGPAFRDSPSLVPQPQPPQSQVGRLQKLQSPRSRLRAPPPPGMLSWSGWFGIGDVRLGSISTDLPITMGAEFRAFGRISPKGKYGEGDGEEFVFSSVAASHGAAESHTTISATAIHTGQVVTFAVTPQLPGHPRYMEGTYTTRAARSDVTTCGWFRVRDSNT